VHVTAGAGGAGAGVVTGAVGVGVGVVGVVAGAVDAVAGALDVVVLPAGGGALALVATGFGTTAFFFVGLRAS
jgi:hypothetical protein